MSGPAEGPRARLDLGPVMRAVVVIAAALVLTAAVRLVFARAVGEDEAFFVIVGRNWLAGLLPYAHGYDVKPPGLFLLVAAAQLLFGPTIASIKALEIVAVAAGAAALHGLAARHVSRPVAWWALVVYPVVTLFASGDILPTILIQAPFVVLAIWAVLEARGGAGGGWLVLAGLAIGAAGMIKQTALFEAIGLVVLASVARRDGVPLVGAVVRATTAIGAGALVIPALFALYFAHHGLLGVAFDGAVIGAAGRLKGDVMVAPGSTDAVRLTMLDAVTRLPALLKPFVGLASLALLAWMRRRAIAARISGLWFSTTVIWFVAAIAGVLAVKAMYDNYMHAAIAPMVLAAGVLVCHGLEAATRAGRRAGAAIATAFAFVPPLVLPMPLASDAADMEAVRAAAAIVRRAGPVPGDLVLVPLRGLPLTVEVGLFPPWRYVDPLHMMCDFPAPDEDPLARVLATTPRFVVTASPERAMVCERADRHAELAAALAERYRPLGVGRGRWDAYAVYERVSPTP